MQYLLDLLTEEMKPTWWVAGTVPSNQWPSCQAVAWTHTTCHSCMSKNEQKYAREIMWGTLFALGKWEMHLTARANLAKCVATHKYDTQTHIHTKQTSNQDINSRILSRNCASAPTKVSIRREAAKQDLRSRNGVTKPALHSVYWNTWFSRLFSVFVWHLCYAWDECTICHAIDLRKLPRPVVLSLRGGNAHPVPPAKRIGRLVVGTPGSSWLGSFVMLPCDMRMDDHSCQHTCALWRLQRIQGA